MSKWYKVPTTMRITEGEYEANVRGMNIVFGAVLGFVLAGTNNLPIYDFCVVLFASAVMVATILYLAHSPYKLFYAGLAAAAIYGLPSALDDPMGIEAPAQLQPTLGVWAAMVLLVEMMPRIPEDEDNKEEPNT